MTDAGADVACAAPADVALDRLEGLHAANVVTRDLVKPSHLGQAHSAQASNADATTMAAARST